MGPVGLRGDDPTPELTLSAVPARPHHPDRPTAAIEYRLDLIEAAARRDAGDYRLELIDGLIEYVWPRAAELEAIARQYEPCPNGASCELHPITESELRLLDANR